MKRTNLIVLLSVFFLGGCAINQAALKNDPHVASHDVEVLVSSNDRRVIKRPVFLNHKFLNDEMILSIRGTVRRPILRRFSKAIVVARFMDQKGNIISEERSNVLFRGSRASRRNREKIFYIKYQDDPKITQCELSIEWV